MTVFYSSVQYTFQKSKSQLRELYCGIRLLPSKLLKPPMKKRNALFLKHSDICAKLMWCKRCLGISAQGKNAPTALQLFSCPSHSVPINWKSLCGGRLDSYLTFCNLAFSFFSFLADIFSWEISLVTSAWRLLPRWEYPNVSVLQAFWGHLRTKNEATLAMVSMPYALLYPLERPLCHLVHLPLLFWTSKARNYNWTLHKEPCPLLSFSCLWLFLCDNGIFVIWREEAKVPLKHKQEQTYHHQS